MATLTIPAHGQQEWRRMLQASEAEQTAWIESDLDRGMPTVDPDASVLTVLIRSKSEITLPLIERKIEEVLRSPSSPDNFTDKSVDPQRFIALAAVAIREAGNVESLKELGKLMKIDERRFGFLVEQTFAEARDRGNPFSVAYQGFDIGDPALDSRIAAWAERELLLLPPPPPKDYSRVPNSELFRQLDIAGREAMINEARTLWAEAMVDKYGGVPTEAQWRSDPIVSHLKPSETDPVHDDMIRRTSEAVEKRAKG
jgi:hypothetical protein